MPTNKKTRRYSVDRASRIRCRRRDLYKELSIDKREALLSQRRTTYFESKSKTLRSISSISGQKSLSIREPSCLDEKADTLLADSASTLPGKGKNIVCNFCVFEIGSTSAAPNEGPNPEATKKGSTSGNFERHNLATKTTKRKGLFNFSLIATFKVTTFLTLIYLALLELICAGSRSTTIGCLNFKELPSNSSILKKAPNCEYCGAKKFEYESEGFCCSNGSIKLVSHEMPVELLNLYLNNSDESKHFRTYIRMYNNMFAFTSLGVKYDKELSKRNQGIYTFRVQGQMYHFVDDLIPSDKQPRNLQLYFYDDATEMSNRMASSDKLDQVLVQKLMNILKLNPYSIFLKSLMQVPDLPNFYIALKCDSAFNQHVYNLPSVSEVAAVWLEQEVNNNSSAPHIRIYTCSNKSQLVNYYYGCYDPLQYPLLFPYGQNGWHCGIKRLVQNSNKRSGIHHQNEQLPSLSNMCSVDGLLHMEAEILQKGKRKRENISCREYYCYKFQMRDNDKSGVLHSGRLFQQYSVDEFIKVETQRRIIQIYR